MSIKLPLFKHCNRLLRFLVWASLFFACLLIGVVALFAIHGVPAPLLASMIDKANQKGIAIDIEHLSLSRRGWHAEGVHYFSPNPNDLEPLFNIKNLYLSLWGHKVDDNVLVDICGEDVKINPSLSWRLNEIPKNHPILSVKRIDTQLVIFPNGIEIRGGQFNWLNVALRINGRLLFDIDKAKKNVQYQKKHKEFVSKQQIAQVESILNTFQFSGPIHGDVYFFINLNKPTTSKIDCNLLTNQFSIQGVSFRLAELKGAFLYPTIKLNTCNVWQQSDALKLSGFYRFDTKNASLSLFNNITNPDVLKIIPEAMTKKLDKASIQLDTIPWVTFDFGPARVDQLLNKFEGAFLLKQVHYKGIIGENLNGYLKNSEQQIELTGLKADIKADKNVTHIANSAMSGGPITGQFIWEKPTHKFEIQADTDFDPLLLVPALSPISIATNVMMRFRCPDKPPHSKLKLGACVDDWKTFFLNITAIGEQISYEGVVNDFADVSVSYSNKLLRLDPIKVIKDKGRAEGTVEIDFNDYLIQIDAVSSIDPAYIEKMIWPKSKIFSNWLRFNGDIAVTAKGIIDPIKMIKSDLQATISAETLDLPFLRLNNLNSEISITGESFFFNNATFNLYGGTGKGTAQLLVVPKAGVLPLQLDCQANSINFQPFCQDLMQNVTLEMKGKMAGKMALTTDLKKKFFKSANGKGHIHIKNGNLGDLRFFQGLTNLMRKFIPNFKLFSITKLIGDFQFTQGTFSSKDLYLEGDVISAQVNGTYHFEQGIDAYLKIQLLRESILSKIVRPITAPLFKLLEVKVNGPITKPNWRLDKFTKEKE